MSVTIRQTYEVVSKIFETVHDYCRERNACARREPVMLSPQNYLTSYIQHCLGILGIGISRARTGEVLGKMQALSTLHSCDTNTWWSSTHRPTTLISRKNTTRDAHPVQTHMPVSICGKRSCGCLSPTGNMGLLET